MATAAPHETTADNPFAAGCAWIEGEFLPIAQARIPITDTGFTRSDCTYDVVSVWNGRFFRLGDHLDRFEHSCRSLRLSPPLSRDAMHGVLNGCVARTGLRAAYVEIIATRGVPPPGERDPRRFENRCYAFAIPYVWIVKPDDQMAGVDLAVARGAVRIDPGAVDPRVKNFHWGDLIRGLFEAYDRGAANVILLNAAGDITEGPGFNIFALIDGALWTPASGVLEGITRRTVIDLAAREGLVTHTAMFGLERLHAATEVFITSTAGGVMPVTSIDARPVGLGRAGAVTLRLRDAYWRAHDEPAWSRPVNYDAATALRP